MKKDKTLISGQSEAQDTPERQAGRLTLFALLLLVLMGIFLLRVRAVGGITFPSLGWLVLVFAGLTILLLVALVLSGLSLWLLRPWKRPSRFHRPPVWFACGALLVSCVVFGGIAVPHDTALLELVTATVPLLQHLRSDCQGPLQTLQTDAHHFQASVEAPTTESETYRSQLRVSFLQIEADIQQLSQQSEAVQMLTTSNQDLQPLLSQCQSVYQRLAQINASPDLTLLQHAIAVLPVKTLHSLLSARLSAFFPSVDSATERADIRAFVVSVNAMVFPFRLSFAMQ